MAVAEKEREYRVKTVDLDGCKVTICRPILTEEEERRAHEQAQHALGVFFADVERQKQETVKAGA